MAPAARLASAPVAPPRFAFLDHSHPIAFAHRGGALEAPENTWAAFTHAVELGFRYMETDVHSSRDGIVVAIHDPDLKRTSDRGGLVRDMQWRDLAGVRVAGDEPIPRLDELLSSWPDIRWNIDAKHDSVVGPLVETIRRTGAIDRVCITSFSEGRLRRLRQALGPGVCMAMGPLHTTVMRLASISPTSLSRAGVSRLAGFAAAQVPVRRGRIPLVDRRFIDTCHRAGLQVHVWTVDDAVTMDRLLELGVDGIMTDRPTALKDVLVRRKEWG
jgi:glycerophosphoryl diester phosphodiesterase